MARIWQKPGKYLGKGGNCWWTVWGLPARQSLAVGPHRFEESLWREVHSLIFMKLQNVGRVSKLEHNRPDK